MCNRVVSLTSKGHVRRHRTPEGVDCTHRATYATPVIVEVPPIHLPPMSRPPSRSTVTGEVKVSRLEHGSNCQECGKWLPGERRLCGRCYATRR